MRILDVSGNYHITDDADILWQLSSIEELRINDIPLLGTGSSFPENYISKLSDLRVLEARNVGYGGTIPTSIGSLSKLEILNLEGSISISGTIPLELWKLPKLRILNLRGIGLEGHLPDDDDDLQIGLSQALEVLDLGGNALNGTLPAILGTSMSNLGKYYSSSLFDCLCAFSVCM